MTYTSPTTINGSQGIGSFLSYANEVSGYWLSNMILIGLYIIFLMGWYRTQGNDFIGGMAVSGFATSVIATLFWIGGFISGTTLGICFAVMFVGIAAVLMNNK